MAYAPYTVNLPGINLNPELTAQEKQTRWNQVRGQAQGGWQAGAQGLKDALGYKGFVPGQSGLADSALGKYYSEQATGLGNSATTLAVEDAKQRFANQLAAGQLQTQRDVWSNEFGASREDAAQNALYNYINAMQGSQALPWASYYNAMGQATTPQWTGK